MAAEPETGRALPGSASDSARDRLADRQAALLRAMTGAGPVPEGFDAGSVRAAGGSLAAKRARSAARAWPALAAALGAGFGPRFAAFAAATALPEWGGPLADGRAFARSLSAAERRALPDAARLEILAVDLRYRAAGSDGSLVPRRGPAVVGARLRESRRGVLAARLPVVGERWVAVPLFFPGGRGGGERGQDGSGGDGIP